MDIQTQDTSKHAQRYPEEVKELAYQLWAFVASRNASEVVRRLATEEHGGHDVPYQTVAYWVREYGWADRAARDVDSIAPDLRHQVFSELLFAGLEGAKYIRKVIDGDEHPDKVRVAAAIGAVDRIGFSPVGNRNPSDGIGAPQSKSLELPSFSAMTPDQLREYEQTLKRQGR